jgi:hypothetical protein
VNIKSRAGRRQLQLFNTLWCLNITLLSPRVCNVLLVESPFFQQVADRSPLFTDNNIFSWTTFSIYYAVESPSVFIVQPVEPPYVQLLYDYHRFPHLFPSSLLVQTHKSAEKPWKSLHFCRLPKPGGLRAARDLLQKIQVATPTAQAELKVSRKWWDNGVWMCLIYLRL